MKKFILLFTLALSFIGLSAQNGWIPEDAVYTVVKDGHIRVDFDNPANQQFAYIGKDSIGHVYDTRALDGGTGGSSGTVDYFCYCGIESEHSDGWPSLDPPCSNVHIIVSNGGAIVGAGCDIPLSDSQCDMCFLGVSITYDEVVVSPIANGGFVDLEATDGVVVGEFTPMLPDAFAEMLDPQFGLVDNITDFIQEVQGPIKPDVKVNKDSSEVTILTTGYSFYKFQMYGRTFTAIGRDDLIAERQVGSGGQASNPITSITCNCDFPTEGRCELSITDYNGHKFYDCHISGVSAVMCWTCVLSVGFNGTLPQGVDTKDVRDVTR